MYKKACVLLPVLLLVTVLFACAPSAPTPVSPTPVSPALSPTPTPSSPTTTTFPQMTVRIGHSSSTTYPKQIWAETFKKIVEDRTGGKVKVEIYPMGQLYNDADGNMAVSQGALEMYITSSGELPTWDKRWSVYSFPGLFFDFKQSYAFMDSACCKSLLIPVLEPKGIKIMAQYAMGPTVIFSSKPAKSLADLKGLKLRVTKSAILTATLDALGITGVALGVADTYTALQQGLVDGAATPLSTLVQSKWNEVCKYELDLPVSFGVNVPIASLKWWNSLPQALRDIMEREAIPEATKQTRAYAEGQVNTSASDVAKGGMVVIQLTAADKDALLKLMDPIYLKFEGDIGRDLLECAKKSKA